MNQIDIIFFLGAGASASENAPIQRDLIKEIINSCSSGQNFDIITSNLSSLDILSSEFLESLEIDTNGNSAGIYNANELTLVNYFEDFWQINLTSPNSEKNRIFPTLEECLGVLDLALINSKGYKKYSLTSLRKIRDHIVYLIAKVLDEKLWESNAVKHKKLIKKLDTQKVLKKTAFISMNYDILIDNAIMRYFNEKTSKTNEIPIDYGINFRLENPKYRFSKKPIKLLKIHGSLNWLFCNACNEITLTPFEKSVSTIVKPDRECPRCKSRYSPIIVPPTYYKDMSNIYLQTIYWEIDQILRDAKKIYFCGYSFPEADMHIKYLLKRMEVNNVNSPDIFIINFSDERKNKWEQNKNIGSIKFEYERYQRFLGSNNKLYYTNFSFDDFLEDKITKDNYINYEDILEKETR